MATTRPSSFFSARRAGDDAPAHRERLEAVREVVGDAERAEHVDGERRAVVVHLVR